jgi:hypothetical protein
MGLSHTVDLRQRYVLFAASRSHDLIQINERSAEGDMLKSRRICRRRRAQIVAPNLLSSKGEGFVHAGKGYHDGKRRLGFAGYPYP